MGLIKGFFFLSGAPIRPTTTRERSRRYQRRTNELLEDIADAQDASLPVAFRANQTSIIPSTKSCPDCAEQIQLAARKCRFCGFRFDTAEIARVIDPGDASEMGLVETQDARVRDLDLVACRFCGLEVQKNAVFCKHCRREFTRSI